MRVTIRVRPGSGRTSVGGAHDGALVVRVGERAVDGRATAAALVALAAALGVGKREVSLVSGATARTKVIEIPDSSAEGFVSLLEGSASRRDA